MQSRKPREQQLEEPRMPLQQAPALSQRENAINDLLRSEVAVDLQKMLGRQQIHIARLEAKAAELAEKVVDLQNANQELANDKVWEELKQKEIRIVDLEEQLKQRDKLITDLKSP